MKHVKLFEQFVNESFNEPYYKPQKLKNSRLVMKTRDEIESLFRNGKKRQLEKILDKVNDLKFKLEDKYNKEQRGHNRYETTSSLSTDLAYLGGYAQILSYFINL